MKFQWKCKRTEWGHFVQTAPSWGRRTLWIGCSRLHQPVHRRASLDRRWYRSGTGIWCLWSHLQQQIVGANLHKTSTASFGIQVFPDSAAKVACREARGILSAREFSNSLAESFVLPAAVFVTWFSFDFSLGEMIWMWNFVWWICKLVT